MTKDTKIKLLKWAAFLAGGLYLYNVYKKEGTLKGTIQNPDKFKIIVDTDRMVDSVMPFLSVPDHQKQFLNFGMKEFFRGVKERIVK